MKNDKKGQIGTLLVILIVGSIIFISYSDFFTGLGLSIAGDKESQLRQDWRVVWADETDNGNIVSQEGSVVVGKETITIGLPSRSSGSVNLGKLNGNKGVVLVKMSKAGRPDIVEGSCSVSGYSLKDEELSLVEYQPHTFDDGYDVIVNGVKIGETTGDVSLSLSCTRTGGRSESLTGSLYFAGEKARTCDLRNDEVVLERCFSDNVNIKQIQEEFDENPTQFCHQATPFTLRTENEGIEAIRKDEGINPFNRGETIPTQRQLTNKETICLSYAVPISQCQDDGCEKCGLGEVNKWDGSKFVCENFLKEDEPRTIREREVVEPKGATSLVWNSNRLDTLSIGSKQFKVENKFSCSVPEGQSFSPPEPEQSCYSSDVSYNGFNKEIQDGSNNKINEHISFEYFATGTVREDDLQKDLSDLMGKYIFSFDDIITMSLKSIEDGKAVMQVQNNLPANEVIFEVKQEVDRTNEKSIDERVTASLNGGSNEIAFDFDNKELGLNTLEIQPFYRINNKLIAGQGVVFGLEIRENEVIAGKEQTINDETVQQESRGFFQIIWDFINNLF